MSDLPHHIRLDPRYPAVVAGAGAVALMLAAGLPEDLAIGAVLIGGLGLLGAAYMTTLNVATFTDTALIVRRVAYPYADMAEVDTTEREVRMITRSLQPYRVRQSSLVLYPHGGGEPRHVDIMNSRGGAEAVAEALRAHLARYRDRPGR
ncbi:hypothetical protein roselon_03401 [Roseibacterium elongatum DSM 19469]|uniref:PH domain-containing protein n=1 Tax=Roseicyclus elongatus DSM 19469 TaxID=1294273 RepID=W8RWR8_9RHOB|nr:hypothetical protein [Roseibacterium elongatum]AHM05659.1 hypothetical protein roselon_03401 [Roseibacterium elongatum DSM 19469]